MSENTDWIDRLFIVLSAMASADDYYSLEPFREALDELARKADQYDSIVAALAEGVAAMKGSE